jgi:hypothetical protein
LVQTVAMPLQVVKFYKSATKLPLPKQLNAYIYTTKKAAMKRNLPYLFVSFAILLFACKEPYVDSSKIWSGYVPIYATEAELADIRYINTPLPTENAGKIYICGNYIFQNEVEKGFHIIDNQNTSNPVKIGFLKVPKSTEIAIKANYLYTNNYTNLVIINISNPTNPVLANKIANSFPATMQDKPTNTGASFLCPDNTKGIIIRWEFTNDIESTKRCK